MGIFIYPCLTNGLRTFKQSVTDLVIPLLGFPLSETVKQVSLYVQCMWHRF